VARTIDGEAVGCGAFRPLHDGVAEAKRMYSRAGTIGVGRFGGSRVSRRLIATQMVRCVSLVPLQQLSVDVRPI